MKRLNLFLRLFHKKGQDVLVDFDLLTVLLGFAVFIVIAGLLKYHFKKNNSYLLFLFIMSVYFLAVAKLTLFPFPLFTIMGGGSNLLQNINLIPFYNGISMQDIYNVMLTIPLGFGMPFLWKTLSLKKIMASALLSGTVIETLQLLLALVSKGFTFRTIDIDDVICNFVGTWVGFGILILFSVVYVKLIWNSAGLNSLWRSVHSVCRSVICTCKLGLKTKE